MYGNRPIIDDADSLMTSTSPHLVDTDKLTTNDRRELRAFVNGVQSEIQDYLPFTYLVENATQDTPNGLKVAIAVTCPSGHAIHVQLTPNNGSTSINHLFSSTGNDDQIDETESIEKQREIAQTVAATTMYQMKEAINMEPVRRGS
jgi:hypothetical protein